MEYTITGKAWVGGDNITVYQIVAQNRWQMDALNAEELSKWLFEDADSRFKNKENEFKNEGYSIVVAGKNFGCGGKSIEHPVVACIGAGVRIVLADSFARYNFRNSINNGLPVFVCEGINKWVKTGDVLSVDLQSGLVTNNTTGQSREITPLTDFAMKLLESGGLIAYTRQFLLPESE